MSRLNSSSPSSTPFVTLRAPGQTSASLSSSRDLTPPPLSWLAGTWYVTHSTLPMWKSKRNVHITYTVLPSAGDGAAKLDDLVEYQSHGSAKIKTVHGVDTAVLNSVEGSVESVNDHVQADGRHDGTKEGWAWDWRGKGWLKIMSSRWEVLGWGEDDQDNADAVRERNRWVVTYFARTLFTPAGIDIYSRSASGVSGRVLEGIKEALAGTVDPSIQKLAGEIFPIKMDERA